MADTPSWLTDENVKAAASNPTVQKAATAAAKVVVEEESKKYGLSPSTPTNDVESQSKVDPTASAEALGVTPEVFKKIQMWGLILRVSYMVMSILMATAAALELLNSPSLSIVFIALYVFFFAIIICCFEVALNAIAVWIASNFGFLYTLFGRLLFMVFVASLCYNLGIMGIIVMALLLLVVVVNIAIIILYPKYEDWLRAKHFATIDPK